MEHGTIVNLSVLTIPPWRSFTLVHRRGSAACALKADLAGSPSWTRLMARQGHGSKGIGEARWLVYSSKPSVSQIYISPKHHKLTIQMVCRARNDTCPRRGGRARSSFAEAQEASQKSRSSVKIVRPPSAKSLHHNFNT